MSRVLRVQWVPGSDWLLGACHCGVEHKSDDPVELWDWLLAHEGSSHGRGSDPQEARR